MERVKNYDRLFLKGCLCYQHGRYEEAINCFQTSLKTYQEKGKHEMIIESLLMMHNCFQILGKTHESVANYQQCLPIFTQNSVNESLKGRFLLEVGHCLKDTHKYQDGRDYFRQALEIAKHIKDRKLECECYQGLANLCGMQEQFREALQYAERAAKIAEQDNLEKDKHELDNIFGNAYSRLGRPKEAIKAFTRYLEFTRQCGNRPDEGKVLDSLSKCYLKIHDYHQATLCAQESVKIGKNFGFLELESLGYRNIGICLREKGQCEEAMRYHKQELDLAIKMKDKELQGIALTSLGNVCLSLSQFSDAMGYFNKSQTLYLELGRQNATSPMHNNLGLIYLNTGRYHKAAEHYEQSLLLSQSTGDRSNQKMAYQNLADVYQELNKLDLSRECKWKAIIIGIQIDDKHGEIGFLNKLGGCFCLNRDLKKAIQFGKKALVMSLYINNSQWIGTSYINIADTYRQFGMTSVAIPFYKMGLKIFNESGNRHQKAFCLIKIARSFYELSYKTEEQFNTQNIQQAEQYSRESLQTHEEIFGDLKDKHDLKVSIVDTYINTIKMLAIILTMQERCDEALFICDRGRACALDDTLKFKYSMQQQHPKRVSLDNSHLTGLLPEKSCLLVYSFIYNAVYFWIFSQQQPLHFQKNTFDDGEIIKQLTKYISQLIDSAYQSLGVRNMTDNDCEDRSLQNHTEDSENDPNHEPTGERMLLEDIDYTVQPNLSLMLRGPTEAKASGSGLDQNVKEPLKELFELLIAPIQEHLSEDEIVIVPEGPLYRVPFSALQDPQTGRYLCESHRIRIAPSLSTLKILKESPPDYHCSKDALVVGNPCTENVMFRGKKKGFTNLPNAEMEASLLGSILGTPQLIGQAATKDAVKEHLKDANIIHIAAHGDINTGEIALAPGRSAESKPIPDEEDYMLTMQEVQEIGVRAKLVVLSCCHSGRGEIRAEGVVGMARAFLAAGARSVVAALWAISDQATLDFMAGFYTHLKYGESVSESLNESRKELIKERKYKHPKYWAPFVLIGDDVTIFK